LSVGRSLTAARTARRRVRAIVTLGGQARFVRTKEKCEMTQDARQLWIAAAHAEDHGDTARAAALFREIIEAYPGSDEAIDAVFFLTSGQRRQEPAQKDAHY
jgi:TolA-binding protein